MAVIFETVTPAMVTGSVNIPRVRPPCKRSDGCGKPGEKPPPVGWKRLSDNPENLPPGLKDAVWEDPESGFRAALYESEIDGSRVLAFRGTAGKAGWFNNFQQGLGYESEQYNRAIALASKTKDAYPEGLDIAGHSLGGGSTTAASIVTETPGYTYNGSGLHPNTIKAFNKTRADGDQLIHAYHGLEKQITDDQNAIAQILATT